MILYGNATLFGRAEKFWDAADTDFSSCSPLMVPYTQCAGLIDLIITLAELWLLAVSVYRLFNWISYSFTGSALLFILLKTHGRSASDSIAAIVQQWKRLPFTCSSLRELLLWISWEIRTHGHHAAGLKEATGGIRRSFFCLKNSEQKTSWKDKKTWTKLFSKNGSVVWVCVAFFTDKIMPAITQWIFEMN